jgi:hypothetical protein
MYVARFVRDLLVVTILNADLRPDFKGVEIGSTWASLNTIRIAGFKSSVRRLS